jgi:hypothetical protein
MMTPNTFPLNKRHYAENQEVYGFKLYGVCETEIQKNEYCEKLQKQNKNYNILPFNVGEIMEFDVDTSENNPETKIIYREEELNKTIGNKEFNASINTPEQKDELVIDEMDLKKDEDLNEDENLNEEYVEKENEMPVNGFVNLAKQQSWCCVQFYPAEAYKSKKPELVKNKKIVSFKMHGVFDSFDNAVKYRNKHKNQLIFVAEVGKWIAFNWDLLKNTDSTKTEFRWKALNDFIELYEKALMEETEEEEQRKKEHLKGANVVSGQFDVMGTSKKETEEREYKNTHVETEEEQLEREIKELKEKESQLNRVVCTKEELDKKCDELLELHKILITK